MRSVYAVTTGLALVLTPAVVQPDLASAAPLSSGQTIDYVIQRAMSQRGVPFVYGGGNTTGPTGGASQRATTSPGGRFPGTATVPGTLPGTVPGTLPGALPGAPTVPGTATLPGASAAPSPGVAGFDASGLVQYAFAGAGIKMPRTSGEQCNVGRKVPPAQARRGDLMCYGPGGSQSVAIYLGNGQMIEATEPAVTVSAARTSNMTPYLTRIIE